MEYAAKVFIADSSEDFCANLTAALQSINGFRVVGTAENGEQTIQMVARLKPDLLVLDMMLPGKDGLAVLKAVSAMDHKPMVLATSVFLSPYISASAMDLGVRYVMPKPCDIPALVDRLREIQGREILRLPAQRPLKEADLEAMITGIIHEIGIPAHIRGYQYLREAILMAVNDISVVNAITTVLYPRVAEVFGTTPSRVERAIRHAIKIGWDQGTMQHLFGSGKPTNGAFIAYMADQIRIQRKGSEASQG